MSQDLFQGLRELGTNFGRSERRLIEVCARLVRGTQFQWRFQSEELVDSFLGSQAISSTIAGVADDAEIERVGVGQMIFPRLFRVESQQFVGFGDESLSGSFRTGELLDQRPFDITDWNSAFKQPACEIQFAFGDLGP
jgi:hypothetical protein